jgi:hypothetical protein
MAEGEVMVFKFRGALGVIVTSLSLLAPSVSQVNTETAEAWLALSRTQRLGYVEGAMDAWGLRGMTCPAKTSYLSVLVNAEKKAKENPKSPPLLMVLYGMTEVGCVLPDQDGK